MIQSLQELSNELEDCARNIYYALAQIKEENSSDPAIANLQLALKYLHINSPEDVGLSSSSLFRKTK